MGGISRKRKRTCLCRCSNVSFFASGCILVGLWNVQIALRETLRFSRQKSLDDLNSSVKHRLPNRNLPWRITDGMIPSQLSTEKLDDNPDVPYYKVKVPTHGACQNTRGVYHVAIADEGGGVGTALFQLIIDQILYAELQNLTPWIHLTSNVSKVIDDPVVHSSTNNTISFSAYTGPNLVPYQRGIHWKDIVPGPLNETAVAATTKQQLNFTGTGIWGHYFEPVSSFVPGDRSCEEKVYVTMGFKDIYLVIPGLHGYADISVRCWRYDFLPDYVSQPHRSFHSWITPQRERAARIVKKYFRFRPYLKHRARKVNPDCSIGHQPCLGIHIRHSDKSAGRRLINVTEFLPFCKQFVDRGGKQIYLATDSVDVLKEIEATWPVSVASIIRASSDVVRSTDKTAVFDIANHHRTNQEVLVEILALSQCQFMIHGYSAVSEAAIWINFDLHSTSVNLEDDDHLDSSQFGSLISLSFDKIVPKNQWPQPLRKEDGWPPAETERQKQDRKPGKNTCDGYDGILLISSVGKKAGTARAMFTSILNQLIYADRYNLKPWIHLNSSTSPLIYDPGAHGGSSENIGFQMLRGPDVGVDAVQVTSTIVIPGHPIFGGNLLQRNYLIPPGNGIWDTYFEPVSDFIPDDESCRNKPLIEMEEKMVMPGLDVTPWAVKAWRYDTIPESMLFNKTEQRTLSMSSWLLPMRVKASAVVQKYFRFLPYLSRRAEEVNPGITIENPCLAVHLRLSDKTGKHRRKVRVGEFQPYMEAFARAGGRIVFVATDTQRPLRFMFKHFPSNLTRMIRTQGNHIVRSTNGDWPTHILDNHHRVNSETLVDILALSKCQLMLHGYSTLSEAAMYVNPSLVSKSVNLEDAKAMTVTNFEMLARFTLGFDKSLQASSPESTKNVNTLLVGETQYHDPVILRQKKTNRTCRQNAIIYLAQKVHSSYGRDSYGKLLQSLNLLNKNYLSVNDHINNTDIFIFHTGDFNSSDIDVLENQIGISSTASSPSYGVIHLVDLSGSRFWARPSYNAFDDPKSWYAWPLFSEGYRRMMHWFAIDVWDFFELYNRKMACEYRYLFRLDEDSYIHSPIKYDLFELMRSHQYVYGFRMCAYEMKVTQRMSTLWMKRYPHFVPQRHVELGMCGFYNNFFLADLQFFQSAQVSQFLRFIDKQGHIYRRRLGDLMIHSLAVYWFAPEERIHRFLDFTYEHGTFNETNGCLLWGGIQAGYDDSNAAQTMSNFYQTLVLDRRCSVNASYMSDVDLSPTYAHLPGRVRGQVTLQTITAGAVEFPQGKGSLSG
jgi:Glycolipid 2-alpha-mannosyltransferase